LTDTIEVVVRLTISEEDFDVNRLEEGVRAARDEAGRELLVKVLEALEERALENHPEGVRQRRVERRLDTSLGQGVFQRWRVKQEGKTAGLLDRLLGWARHGRVSPAVKKRAGELASRMTYREASLVLSEELGTRLSAQRVHPWVQAIGAAVEEQEWAPSPSPPAVAQVGVVEWDDTMVRSQEEGERQFALKLGIGYSQKQRQGPRRYKLTDKVGYGGVEEPGVFGERFYARMEGPFQVEEAAPVVVKGEGAEWICLGAAQVFPGQAFPLDRWHLLDRLAQFAGHLPRLCKRLRRWVFQGRVKALVRSLRPLVGAEARSEQARQEWLGYVTRHAEAITAGDRLRPPVSPQARPLLTHGTGAMEKNLETVMARRFKRWGLRWRRRGAQHLLKLRLWIARCGTSWFEALNSRPPQLTNA